MKNQLKGCVKINVEGRNLYKFINVLHESNIDCFAQYCRNNVFYAEIYRSNLKEIQSIAESLDMNLSSFEYDTISSIMIRHRKRFGLIIGVILLISISVYFSEIVMTIEIQGNSAVSDSDIMYALKELNIKQGTFIKDINFPYCENELMLMVDGISWAGMHITGNRIVVEVTEIVDKPEVINERIPCNIVSGKDAYITYTSVYDGQLMHKVGDYVPMGTLLINGVTKDETGHVNLHHSRGKIIGTYSETVTFEEDYTTEQYDNTGKSLTKKYLKLFNFKIPLTFRKNSYINYNSEENIKYFKVFGKELPIGIIKNKITEIELNEVTFSDEELSQRIMEKIYLYEKNFLNEDITILDRTIETQKKDNSLVYNVTYNLEGDIGEQMEILIK